MNRLPIEILEMIFCQLPAGTDFEKCVNTCTKWRKIIPDIYPNFDKSKYNSMVIIRHCCKNIIGISATMCHSAEKISSKTGMPDHSSLHIFTY